MTTLWTENVERWCISCFGFNQHRNNCHIASGKLGMIGCTIHVQFKSCSCLRIHVHCTLYTYMQFTNDRSLNFDVSTKYTSISYWHCNFESHSEAHYSNDGRIIIIIDNIRSEICVVCHVCNLSPIEAISDHGHMYCNIILYP